MEELAKLISALASLAWPLIFAVLLFKLYSPLRTLIESARGRKFSIKIAGNELTMEEASEQQRIIVSDLQTKIAEFEKRFGSETTTLQAPVIPLSNINKRILWVDDRPKNNSYLVALLEERGARVDIAMSTEKALEKLKKTQYDIAITDVDRPEGERAGIDLTKIIKTLIPNMPIYIFCGSWAARNLREEALNSGATEITSSGTTLLSILPLSNES